MSLSMSACLWRAGAKWGVLQMAKAARRPDVLRRIGSGVAIALSMAAASLGPPALSQDFSRGFDWPAMDAQAIPDARLGAVLESAIQEARQAAEYSRQGEAAASRANRLVRLRSAFGRGPQLQIVGDGVTMEAVSYGDEGRALFGDLSWASGAKLTGSLSESIGEYQPPEESSIRRFAGFLTGTISPDATPMTGEFIFKTGDQFFGSYLTGRNALGVYASANGEFRFVGEIDFTAPAFRPLQGNLVDRNGRTIAVVRMP